MSYLVVGVREFFGRYMVPPFVSSWTYARDLFTRRGKRKTTATAARAAEKRRRKTLWQRSRDD